ncbi:MULTISPECIES: xylose isomerase [unclassified Paenibacillus]|uniref:xylose isomerase n=1 Tax=unclassified Paenibacillus TaxID=185978 RepID=UPI000954718B|nr:MULTISPECIES: xylose isomerase [unclassified Paenibacillus]ASS65392.1 sugar phosphate isomerase/epimerase [Paenibacillus sp. RUD330]SIQ37763.1 hypothetical protein SAMN05880555_1545 [Paenibacillus sp. RU4X]SIQ59934.1 hypothetical protein SAMN05880570_1543 [Paenibacillus sp. RU4T]
MEIKLFQALWGLEGRVSELMKRAAGDGYAGIEAPLPPVGMEEEFKEQLSAHGLSFIAQIVTSGNHSASFAAQAERAAAFGPVLIVSHSARDFMPFREQLLFFEGALKVERSIGIAVGHETHRSRAMFTPWNTSALLRELPDLAITADFSHWCCVTETMLEEFEEDLRLAIERTVHIHARLGHPEGPQVAHPAAPENKDVLQAFKKWWGAVLAERARNGAGLTTVTPEFGPAGYMPSLPFTRQPVADLREVNDWMAGWFREAF